MSKDHISRLIEKQEEELETITKRIELYSKYKDDYDELKKLINTMQDKVKYPHRIPIAGSRLAFVQGNIIHTNEVTVLLGDNIFALRSAKQATQIVDRRLENLNDLLNKSEDAKRKTKDWLEATREHKQEKQEFVEIIETM